MAILGSTLIFSSYRKSINLRTVFGGLAIHYWVTGLNI
ncbi:hypothetical protein [Jeotgalibacillus marinus]|uniref:Uncharacterized protein n=1 Tax=Jeotgalibacillus marinus TaxID=86667 RepID=A0ABV3Q4N8_9BACL